MSNQTNAPKWSSVVPGSYSDQLSISIGRGNSQYDPLIVTPQNVRQESPSLPTRSTMQRSHLNSLRDIGAGFQLLSSPPSRTRQTNDDAASVRSYGSASSCYTLSSVSSSTGSSMRIKKCYICSKPPATDFCSPLQQCSSCGRRFHADCLPLGGKSDGQPLSSRRCGKCIKKHNSLSSLGQISSDHGQTSSQLRQISLLQALSSTSEPVSYNEHPAKRRKIDGVNPLCERSRDQDVVNLTISDGCGAHNADALPPPKQATGSTGINPAHLDILQATEQGGSTEPISDPRIVSKVGSPLTYPSIKQNASHSEQGRRAPDSRTEELRKQATKDSHLKHLMREVGAGRASKAQLEEFKYYVVTLCGPVKPQAKTPTPASPKTMSGAAFRGHIKVETKPDEPHRHKTDQYMPFQETHGAQARFIDPQTNELSPPYSPLPAQQCLQGIPEQADVAIQVDLHTEMCDPRLDQSVVVEPSLTVEPSNDTQVQTDKALLLKIPVVPLAACSKCKKRVFLGNSDAMSVVLCTACRNSTALSDHLPGLIKSESSPEVVVPESPAASLGYLVAPKQRERSHELETGRSQSGRTMTQNRLDEEIYGTTSCPSTPATVKTVHCPNEGLGSPNECSRAVVESLKRDLHLAMTDKENIELAHRQALQAKDREVKQVIEAKRDLQRRHKREKRGSELKIQKAESDLDGMDKRHTQALQEKELQLLQAREEISKLQEQHAKALEEKETELEHAKAERAEIDQLREKLEVRNTNEQEYELANLRDEMAALKDRLAIAEKPDDEWIKYLPTTPNFYDAAPHLHPNVVSFDREAKLKEIEKRPSRKQTFGKRLFTLRKERGLYPHYLPGKHPAKEPSPARTAVAVVMSSDGGKVVDLEEQGSGGSEESSEESLSGNEKAMKGFAEMMAVPNDPIPCLVDNQLAWRDGTRDAKGRLPRAKVTYKVGRNVAGQLR